MNTKTYFMSSPGKRLPKFFSHGFTLSVVQTETKASVWGELTEKVLLRRHIIFCLEVRDKKTTQRCTNRPSKMASKTVTGSILSCNLIKRLKDTKLFSFFS